MKALVGLLIVLPILLWTIPAYSEENGSIQIEIKDWMDDLVSEYGTQVIILQEKDLYTTIDLSSNPQTIENLPQGHTYSFEVVRHGMHLPTGKSVKLDSVFEKVSISIPTEGGVKFFVYYEDGYTPINDANIFVKSNNDQEWSQVSTNHNGETLRSWLQSTTEEEFYFVEVSLGPGLSFIHSPVKISPGAQTDIKIKAPWPSIIDGRIAVHVLKETEKVTKDDGTFVVELYDSNNKKIAESKVSQRGDAYFSKLPIGEYTLKALKKSDVDLTYETWGSVTAIISENEQLVKIFEEKQESDNLKNGCNCVAFRLDDVQDYYLTQAQTGIIQVFQEKNADLTIGVIGGFVGTDEELIDFIKNRLDNNNADFEIASHSWNNIPLTKYTKEEQSSLIKSANDAIYKNFGVVPNVFIPPQNAFNEDTLSALEENNFSYLSSSFTYDSHPFPLEGQTLYRFPQVTQTAVINEIGLWDIVNRTTIIDDIVSNINNYGFAVVMMHPMEFSETEQDIYRNIVIENQLDELRILIDDIRNEGYEMVLISEINNKPIQIPTWIKNNADWWSNNLISESDFTLGIEFLIKDGIISIPELPEPETFQNSIVPDWIKNNAGWWANGMITDSEFVNGIEYLIKNGIIRV